VDGEPSHSCPNVRVVVVRMRIEAPASATGSRGFIHEGALPFDTVLCCPYRDCLY
jgi:hypothetical protein